MPGPNAGKSAASEMLIMLGIRGIIRALQVVAREHLFQGFSVKHYGLLKGPAPGERGGSRQKAGEIAKCSQVLTISTAEASGRGREGFFAPAGSLGCIHYRGGEE